MSCKACRYCGSIARAASKSAIAPSGRRGAGPGRGRRSSPRRRASPQALAPGRAAAPWRSPSRCLARARMNQACGRRALQRQAARQVVDRPPGVPQPEPGQGAVEERGGQVGPQLDDPVEVLEGPGIVLHLEVEQPPVEVRPVRAGAPSRRPRCRPSGPRRAGRAGRSSCPGRARSRSPAGRPRRSPPRRRGAGGGGRLDPIRVDQEPLAAGSAGGRPRPARGAGGPPPRPPRRAAPGRPGPAAAPAARRRARSRPRPGRARGGLGEVERPGPALPRGGPADQGPGPEDEQVADVLAEPGAVGRRQGRGQRAVGPGRVVEDAVAPRRGRQRPSPSSTRAGSASRGRQQGRPPGDARPRAAGTTRRPRPLGTAGGGPPAPSRRPASRAAATSPTVVDEVSRGCRRAHLPSRSRSEGSGACLSGQVVELALEVLLELAGRLVAPGGVGLQAVPDDRLDGRRDRRVRPADVGGGPEPVGDHRRAGSSSTGPRRIGNGWRPVSSSKRITPSE